jgi:hypothetical protein
VQPLTTAGRRGSPLEESAHGDHRGSHQAHGEFG